MRCLKFLARVSLVLLLAAMICTPAVARSIPGAPNEVDDPWFQDPDGPGNWYVNPPLMPGGYPTVTPNDPAGDLPGGYLDPGRSPGDKVFVRTIVDDAESPLWDPNLSSKEIDLSFFAHVEGDGYIDVWFDWWNDPNIPEPSNDPNQPPPPDGRVGPYRITATGMHPGYIIVPPEETPENESWMRLYSFHDIWDHQPRWVSIEIEAGIFLASQFGGEALITGVDFEAQCIPEPSALAVLCLGVLGLVACTRPRRRN